MLDVNPANALQSISNTRLHSREVSPTSVYAVAGNDGEVRLLDLTGMMKPGMHNIGLQMQMLGDVGSAVLVEGTLVPSYVLAQSNTTANFPWATLGTLNTSAISVSEAFPSVLRVSFTGKAVLYLSAY